MQYPERYRTESLKSIEAIDVEQVGRAIELLAAARAAGRNIFVCGNGGSAMVASHFATEMTKGASYGRTQRFRVMALAESVCTLTAYSNDVSYECVFAEQLKNFAQAGDVVMAVSGSGNSANVVRALEYANSIGCRTVAFTGRDGGLLAPLAELNIHVRHPHMGHIEDAHHVALHMIAYYFMEEEREHR
jgi:D-sedoheptulose 7-phosphate isomerase